MNSIHQNLPKQTLGADIIVGFYCFIQTSNPGIGFSSGSDTMRNLTGLIPSPCEKERKTIYKSKWGFILKSISNRKNSPLDLYASFPSFFPMWDDIYVVVLFITNGKGGRKKRNYSFTKKIDHGIWMEDDKKRFAKGLCCSSFVRHTYLPLGLDHRPSPVSAFTTTPTITPNDNFASI